MTALRTEAIGYREETTEGAGIFRLPPPDREPVPQPARVACLWDGTAWWDVDPATGSVLGFGRAIEEPQ